MLTIVVTHNLKYHLMSWVPISFKHYHVFNTCAIFLITPSLGLRPINGGPAFPTCPKSRVTRFCGPVVAHMRVHVCSVTQQVYAVWAIGVLSSIEFIDILRPNCKAQPMYVLTPTCSSYTKWCGSDDDAHNNTGRESPLRRRRSTPQLVATMQFQADSCFAMELLQCVKLSLGQLLVQLFLNTYGRFRGLGRSQHWDVDNRFNCALLRRLNGDWSRRCIGQGGRRFHVFDHKSERCVGHGRRWSTVFVHRSLLCVGHSWSWSNVIHHRSRRCVRHAWRWKDGFVNGSMLNILHRCRPNVTK